MYGLSRENIYTCCLDIDIFTAPCCSGYIITDPLPSNGRLIPTPLLRLSDVMSHYNRCNRMGVLEREVVSVVISNLLTYSLRKVSISYELIVVYCFQVF
jgi:hypothetical protein